MKEKRYVWLNINTGEFSNTWNEETHNNQANFWTKEYLEKTNKSGWKLIEFTCLNDANFEFYDKMRLR